MQGNPGDLVYHGHGIQLLQGLLSLQGDNDVRRGFQQFVDIRIPIGRAVQATVALFDIPAVGELEIGPAHVEGAVEPPDQIELQRALGHFREKDGFRFYVQIGLDAHLGQIPGHGLGDLGILDIAVVGTCEGDLKSVFMARLLEEFLGHVGVIGQPFDIPVIPNGGRIRDLGRRRGVSPHDLLDDLIFVDGHVHGLSDANIGHGGTRLVAQGQKDGSTGRPAYDVQLGAFFYLVEEFHRDPCHNVHLARDQCGESGRGFFDGADLHLLQGRGTFPVRLVCHHADIGPLHPFLELVGPGPDGLNHCFPRIPGLGGLLVHDEDLVHVVCKPGDRLLGLDLDGVVVDDIDSLDGFSGVQEFGDLRIAEPFKGEFHIRRREGIAVMELDPLAEVELPGQKVGMLPLGGERRFELSPGTLSLEEPVKEIGHVLQAGVGIVPVRIHHSGRGILGDNDG